MGTPRSARRRYFAGGCCWTGRHAASTSSIRLPATATTSGSPSISVRRCRPSSTGPVRSCAGAHPERPPRLGRHGWTCRPRSGGAFTGVRPTPSLAGIPPASGAAFPPLPSWAADAARPVRRSLPGLNSLKPPLNKNRYFQALSLERIRRETERDVGDASGGQMSQQGVDLRRSVQILWRHKILVGVVVVLGILAGAAYAKVYPPKLTSTALVVLPQNSQSSQAAATGGIDSYTATQEVIATSTPV